MERTQGHTAPADDPERALYRELQFFPTPPWAARAGIEALLNSVGDTPDDETTAMRWGFEHVWEPACGQGHLGEAIRPWCGNLRMSDVYDYGRGYEVFAFVPEAALGPSARTWDLIITNPPFPLAFDFVRAGLLHAKTVAILARTTFIESKKRYRLVQDLTRFCPFIERVPMQLGSWDPKLSTATSYAWFIWDCRRLGALELCPIPPGTRERLSFEADLRWAG